MDKNLLNSETKSSEKSEKNDNNFKEHEKSKK